MTKVSLCQRNQDPGTCISSESRVRREGIGSRRAKIVCLLQPQSLFATRRPASQKRFSFRAKTGDTTKTDLCATSPERGGSLRITWARQRQWAITTKSDLDLLAKTSVVERCICLFSCHIFTLKEICFISQKQIGEPLHRSSLFLMKKEI